MGSSSQTNSSTNSNTNASGTASSAPGWAPQVGALTTAYNQAGGALANAQSVQGPNPTTASLTGNGALSNNGLDLSNSGTGAASTGLGALSNFNAGNTNNTQNQIDAANQYVAGQNIDGQVNDAMLNARQQARDVTMPGIEQHAAISGNSNSSRAGIADGLVQRGLAEQATNLGATLRNNAFGTGLGLAQTTASGNNGLNLQAANAAAGQGSNAVNSGQNAYSGALSNTNAANTINQNNYGNGVGNAYAALQNYMKLIGGTNWGSTTNTTGNSTTQGTGTQSTQNDPGLLSNISSGLGILGAFLPGAPK